MIKEEIAKRIQNNLNTIMNIQHTSSKLNVDNIIFNTANTFTMVGSDINATQNANILANDVNILSVQDTSSSQSASYSKSSSWDGSSSSSYTNSSSSSNNKASSVSGNNVNIFALNGDINIVGSKVLAQNNTTLFSTGNVNMIAAYDTSLNQSESSSSGFISENESSSNNYNYQTSQSSLTSNNNKIITNNLNLVGSSIQGQNNDISVSNINLISMQNIDGSSSTSDGSGVMLRKTKSQGHHTQSEAVSSISGSTTVNGNHLEETKIDSSASKEELIYDNQLKQYNKQLVSYNRKLAQYNQQNNKNNNKDNLIKPTKPITPIPPLSKYDGLAINTQYVDESHEDWDESSTSLSATGAMIVAVAIAATTGGAMAKQSAVLAGLVTGAATAGGVTFTNEFVDYIDNDNAIQGSDVVWDTAIGGLKGGITAGIIDGLKPTGIVGTDSWYKPMVTFYNQNEEVIDHITDGISAGYNHYNNQQEENKQTSEEYNDIKNKEKIDVKNN